LISLLYLLKKLRFNRTACQRITRETPHFIARELWHAVCLKMQNVRASEPRNEPRNVCCCIVCPYLFAFYTIFHLNVIITFKLAWRLRW